MRWFVFSVVLFSINFGNAQFTNITNETGITHVCIQQDIGGGLVFFDFDNDGWEDLFFAGGIESDRLYLNDGQGSFEDHSYLLPYFNSNNLTSGAIAGDIDNDGCTDLFITVFDREKPNFLLKNDCEGSFLNITAQAAITESGPSVGASFLDYDLDGDLDIYVANYIDTIGVIRDSMTNEVIGFNHLCYPNYFYENNGNNTFTEKAGELNILGEGCTLALLGYYTERQDAAFYVANDFGQWIKADEMFVYDTTIWSFMDLAPDLGIDAAIYGMGIAIGDVGNDGDNDLYVTNLGANVFYENEEGVYTDNAIYHQIENTFAVDSFYATSWGTFFFDVENDGDLDLFVANGYIPAANFIATSKTDSNKLYVWTEENTFEDQTDLFNLGFDGRNRGCAYSDFDLDGDLDMVVGTIRNVVSTDPASWYQFYRNDHQEENGYLQVLLEGVTNSKDAFGATVKTCLNDGQNLMRTLYSGGTHASQNSKLVHFGLGEATHIDSIIVRWPNGLVDRYDEIPVNSKILIKEGQMDFEILGCLNPFATNYDPLATVNYACKEGTNSTVEKESTTIRFSQRENTLYIYSIESEFISYRILNTMGQLINSSRAVQAVLGEIAIDISFFPPGQYFIQLISAGESRSFKFFKAG